MADTSSEPTLAFETMKHTFEITFMELLWFLFAIIAILLVLAKIGGLDDGAVRVVSDTIPHGVHGKLKGEQP